MSKPCVLVTGVGGRSVGHQILHALLLLGDKYRVVVTDSDVCSFGLYETTARYLVPRAQDPDYIPSITRILDRESVDVILPGTEPEVCVLSQHRPELTARGCSLITNPDPVVKLCSNKWRLHGWLSDNGFQVPRTELGSNWINLVDTVGFPIVGKPTEFTGGSRGVAVLQNEQEVLGFLRENQTTCCDVIFQEYVGTANDEYTVGILVSKAGELIDSIVLHRRLIGLSLGTSRMLGGTRYELSTGYSQGVIIRHPLIQQCCEDLARSLGIRGPANIQCRLVGDEVKVFEVHPRFSGTTSIRAEVGFNEPDILIRNYLFDEKFCRTDYRTDVFAIRAFRNLIVPLSTMRNVPRI